MLGFASYTNLTDTLVYPTFHNTGFHLPVSYRTHFGTLSNESLDPDPILEDTPDPPDEEEIDYTVQPPEVGQNVTVGETGAEVAATSSPLKQKRVLCSFSSQGLTDEGDPDDYPFEAITYGDSPNHLGLPYNDHTYVSATHSLKGPSSSGDEDRLCLLAKLALAKDEKHVDQFTTSHQPFGQSGSGLIISSDELVSQNVCRPASDVLYCATTQVADNSKISSVNSRISMFTTAAPCSFVATNPVNSAAGVRHVVLTSSSGGGANPPLQVHRVSSSLTPHIILRTGLPGLQISTTVSRQTMASSDSGGVVQCPCGYTRNDGPVIQCENCRNWQHVECVSSSKRTRVAAPYVCENCCSHSTQVAQAVVLHGQKMSTISASTSSGVWVARTTTLSTASNSARVLVTNATPNPVSSRQVQLCLPANSSTFSVTQPVRGDMSVFSAATTTTGLLAGNPHCFSLITRPTSLTNPAQPTRSSKRKQDLVTLTGTSAADGLECVTKVPSSIDGLDKLTPVERSFPMEAQHALIGKETIDSSSTRTPDRTFPVINSDMDPKTTSSLHRLLVYDTNDTLNSAPEHKNDPSNISPLSSIVSSDTMVSPSIEAYEETTDLRLSERFYHKMESLLSPPRSPPEHGSLNGFSKDEILPRLPTFKRYQVISFDFNRKGLVALADIYPGEPVIEYHGLCMLLSEYNEMYDYRKHYNPYVLFYKSWTQLPLCVDARKFGNEARFIRRSCTPNCEVRHFVSTFDDPLSGPTSRIRLMVFAIRPITRSTELTLHFDFDYTTCRYLVRCACARKACPVARWFRQTTQFDDEDSCTGTFLSSHSLPLTRKSQLHTRGSAPGPRPRGFMATGLDNYSDILTDEYCVGDGNGDLPWITDGSQPMSHLQPHRTFRRGSRGSNRTYMYDDPSEPVKHRGRGPKRGRRRPASNGHLGLNSRSIVVVKTGGSGRGRPPSINRPLRSNQRHHPGRHRGRITTKSVKINHAAGKQGKSRRGFSDVSSTREDRMVKSRRSASVRETTSPDSSRGSNSRVLSPQLHLDAATDDRGMVGLSEHNSRVNHAPTSPKYSLSSGPSSPITAHSCRPSTSPRFKQAKTVIEANSYIHDETSQSESGGSEEIKPDKQSTKAVRDRTKRRNSSSHDVSSPPRRKGGQLQENDKKKSREEIWMAEVLRRIERMEKKQQHKHRTVSTESDSILPAKTDPVVAKPPADVNNLTGTEVVHISTSSTRECSTDVVVDSMSNGEPENSLKEETLEVRLVTNSEEKEDKLEVEQTSFSDRLCSAPCPAVSPSSGKQEEHLIPVVASEESLVSVAVPDPIVTESFATGYSESHSTTLLSKSRRRRSQPMGPINSPNITAANEIHESREERWLKSQLRRIAELELCTSRKHASLKRSSEAAITTSTEMSIQIDSTITALKEVCDNDASVDSYVDGKPDPAVNGVDEPKSENLTEDDLHTPRRRVYSTSAMPQSEVTHLNHPIVSRKNSTPAQNRAVKTADAGLGRKRSSNPASAEADCELIVYRTSEQDPMAKFSRSRSIDLTSTLPTNQLFQENTPPSAEVTDSSKPVSSSGVVVSTAHCAPRPTKKRWLSQALMEEDNDELRFGDSGTSNQMPEQSGNTTEVTFTQLHLPVVSPIACPVNPKKRIISQFSESHTDHSSNAVSIPSDYTEYHSKSDSLGACSTDSDPAALANEDSCILNSASAHSTPLPPKKATVKQQAEEMRKVRVSLSEYRRRRGLSSSTAPTNANKNAKEGEQPTDPITGKGEVPLSRQLLSPNRLLDEIPKIYQQLQLPEKISLKSHELFHTNASPALVPKNDIKVISQITQSDSAFDELTNDDRMNERGPRTPSEPPDDDDMDCSNTVYVRKLHKPDLSSIVEEAESPMTHSPLHSVKRFDTEQELSDVSRSRSWGKFANDQTIPDMKDDLPQASIGEVVSNGSHRSTSYGLPKRKWSQWYPSGQDDRSHVESNRQVRDPSSLISVHPSRPNSTISVHSSTSPPPPPSISFPSNPMVDLENCRTKPNPPQRRYSGSDTHPGTLDSLGSLEYYIKRDQAIRHWQESHSMDRDKNRRTTKRRVTHPHMDSEHRTIDPRQSSHAAKSHFNPSDSVNRSAPSASDRLIDVEETLCRLQDRLRSQLDRTRLALTPRGVTPNDSRSTYAHLMDSDGDIASEVSLSGHSRTERYLPYTEERISHRSFFT